MAAALCIWKSHEASEASQRDDPAWTNALSFATVGFMSASMGLQGIMGKRVNTQFATTSAFYLSLLLPHRILIAPFAVVLTTVWCELMADPNLFRLNRWVISRDHKVIGIVALFVGGFVSRAILQAIGSAGTLGIGTGIRVLIAVWWLFVPGKPAKAAKK